MHSFVYPKYTLVRRIEVIHIQAAIDFYQQDPEQYKHEQTASHLKSIPTYDLMRIMIRVVFNTASNPCMYARLYIGPTALILSVY